MTAVVRFDHVSKQYRLGSGRSSLRDALAGLPARLLGRSRTVDPSSHFWAIQDVSFNVQPGNVLGIIGSNGAGKTTTLKLLSRITRPTQGRIEVNGRSSSLIELGAGFHPDLTGRENVYLNGVILGLKKHEIDRRFDQIVAFAEMEKFIDTPVKHYSSGMYARLGFAVAAHTDPDLMLIDEVLAVGDINFQRKCYDFIENFVTSGKTAIFVSHNMYVIEQLCSQVVWLNHGQIAREGKPGEVLSAFLDHMEQSRMAADAAASGGSEYQYGRLKIEGLRFRDVMGNERVEFESGEDVVVEIAYNVQGQIRQPHLVLGVVDSQDNRPLFLASMLVDGQAPAVLSGRGQISCKFESVPLMPRAYYVYGEVWEADRVHLLVDWHRLGSFKVGFGANPPDLESGSIRHLRSDAPVKINYSWDTQSEPAGLAVKG